MKKTFIILGAALGVLALVMLLGVGFFFLYYPNVDKPSSVIVERTPERIERGKYLANHVTVCIDCHSTRDYARFSGPVVPGTEGMGGERFGAEMGFPGTFFAGNITPAGIGSFTDGEVLRTITSGVTPDGRVLFPLMAYPHYNEMADEDLYSIIAYIRTLKPIENAVPPSSMRFPVSMFMRALPSTHEFRPQPDRQNIFEYGKYLVNAAGCTDCHTRSVKGQPVTGMEFAGGFEFKTPMGLIRSSNITPDEATGIGLWTQEIFIARFRDYAPESALSVTPEVAGYQTVMPWTMYAGMTEADLGAMFTHLRTLPAVKNEIVKFEPPAR